MSIREEIITAKIFLIRGKKVMLDRDLAKLYGVATKALNQAVKRNKKRFPADFMFRLNEAERRELVTICDRFRNLKHSTANPYAFTEHGILMLSSVLQSKRAIQVNIAIMRVFARFREILSTHKEFTERITHLEKKMVNKDKEIQVIFEVIRKLMVESVKPERRIGFHSQKDKQKIC